MKGRAWESEIWVHVRPAYEALRNKSAAGQTAEKVNSYNKTIMENLKASGESRHRVFNLARLNPNRHSIPEDVVCMSKAEKSARYHFWDQSQNLPKAPVAWPQGKNIPVAVLQLGLDNVRHYGQDALICGFWWAYAQAIRLSKKAGQTAAQEKESEARLKAFEQLSLNCLVDWKLFQSENDIETAAFQLIEDNEEQRENNGFTGFRKILLVSWAHTTIKKNLPKEKQITHEEVSTWLCKHVRFHDPKQKPTANVVRDLMSLSRSLLKNQRVMTSIQECEMLWGRNTMFDEYSKLAALVHKSRSADDLGFMVEMIAFRMKASCGDTDLPENPSKASLQSKQGEASQAQLVRDALNFIRKGSPASWKDHEDLVKALFTPAGFQSMFPKPRAGETAPNLDSFGVDQTSQGHGKEDITPEVLNDAEMVNQSTKTKLSRAPSSLRAVVTVLKLLYSGPSWKRVATGHLLHPPVDGVQFEKLLTAAMPDEWEAYDKAVKEECEGKTTGIG